jgi:hypothetical protein
MSSAQKRISIELLLPQIELFKGREGDVARDQVLLFIDSPSKNLKQLTRTSDFGTLRQSEALNLGAY